MSEEPVAEAKSIIKRIRNLDVTLIEYSYHHSGSVFDYRDDLSECIDQFTRAEAQDDKASMKTHALNILKYYSLLATNARVQESKGLLDRWNDLVGDYNSLLERKRQLESEKVALDKDWQRKYNELVEQYGTMKGRYEQCAKELERIIGATRPPR